jgi:hypothetical protein
MIGTDVHLTDTTLKTFPPSTTRPSVTSATSPRSSEISEDNASRNFCFTCLGSETLLNDIVSSLMDLQLELSKALPVRAPSKIHEVSAATTSDLTQPAYLV